MIPAPFRTQPFTVLPEWIDDNGHLNLAYYLVLFDRGTDALWLAIGIGARFRASGHGTFAAESHILYRAELTQGEQVYVTSHMLALDAKRLHVAHELRRCDDDSLSAQQEIMYLCVNLATRKVAAFPSPFAESLRSAADAHAGLVRPDWVGRRVAMP